MAQGVQVKDVSAAALPMADVVPGLNPSLDCAQLAASFLKAGRIHIPNILTEDSARRLFYALERETPWTAVYNEGSNILGFDKVPPEERQRITMGVWDRARWGFQYFHHQHRLSHYGEPYPNPDHYLNKLVGFLASAPFLDFIREVTGLDAIAWINAEATLYRPFDFLNLHNDQHGENDRLVAYVLNMTPNWRADWGGALQFFDAPDHIEEAYLPAFNALNLFKVPKLHSVSPVAPFGGSRYSVTGWFHAAKTNGGPAGKA